MQKPSERHKLTSDNNIIKFKKPVHDPFKCIHSICVMFSVGCVRELTHPLGSIKATIDC